MVVSPTGSSSATRVPDVASTAVQPRPCAGEQRHLPSLGSHPPGSRTGLHAGLRGPRYGAFQREARRRIDQALMLLSRAGGGEFDGCRIDVERVLGVRQHDRHGRSRVGRPSPARPAATPEQQQTAASPIHEFPNQLRWTGENTSQTEPVITPGTNRPSGRRKPSASSLGLDVWRPDLAVACSISTATMRSSSSARR